VTAWDVSPGDAEAAEFCASWVHAALGGDPDVWRRSFADDLRLPDRALFVARPSSGEEIVGYGRIRFFEGDPDQARVAPAGHYLSGVMVQPAYRRRGVARALTIARLDHLAEWADESWYYTNVTNAASRALHGSLGFEEVTTDFEYPGMTFEGGIGILCRIDLRAYAARRLTAR
jgi:ribosomal protein S18 acetylase RimI-like enzyme